MPSGASEAHFAKPVVGELVFDKFAPRDAPRDDVIVKQEDHDSPLLDFSHQLTPGSARAGSDPLVAEQFFASSTDSTPMFELEAVESDPQGWTSLFEDDIAVSVADETIAPAIFSEPTASPQKAAAIEPTFSTVIDTNSFLPTPVLEDAKIPTSGKKTSAAGAVQKPAAKVDHLGVVSYNRKARTAPLTPVIPESGDPVAMKRAKNTEAARRSRARKLQRMNQLEDKVEELLKKNTELEHEVATLRALLGGQC